jgi:hypothetical protein
VRIPEISHPGDGDAHQHVERGVVGLVISVFYYIRLHRISGLIGFPDSDEGPLEPAASHAAACSMAIHHDRAFGEVLDDSQLATLTQLIGACD